jgi:predicted  nucleic acid-binding Zn-ribbon protein
MLILAALLVSVAYGYIAVSAYRGRMNLLPAIQADLVSAGQRIDSAESTLRSWAADRDAWRKNAEDRIGAALGTVRQQAKQITAGHQQLQTEIEQRTTSLQNQVNGIQAAQKATGDKVANLEEQVHKLQSDRTEQPTGQEPPANDQR